MPVQLQKCIEDNTAGVLQLWWRVKSFLLLFTFCTLAHCDECRSFMCLVPSSEGADGEFSCIEFIRVANREVLDGMDNDEARLYWHTLPSVLLPIHRTETANQFELVHSAPVANMRGTWFVGDADLTYWLHRHDGRLDKVCWPFWIRPLFLAFRFGDASTSPKLVWFLYLCQLLPVLDEISIVEKERGERKEAAPEPNWTGHWSQY